MGEKIQHSGAVDTGDLRVFVESSSSSGIALVFVTGILTLFVLMAAACGRVADLEAQGSKADLARVRAAAAAESGMQYAAARLSGGRYPLFSGTPTDRGDDWTFRGGSIGGFEGSMNPSFSHGEPWDDSGGLFPGMREEGEPFTDRDGDGRFTACSGRLRGGDGGFSLQVVSPEGRIPLNYGRLDAPHQNNQSQYAHRGLVRMLCNLGAVILPVNPAIGRIELTHGGPSTGPNLPGEPILISRLGEHLIGSRPAGGYRSLEEVDGVLAAKGYSAAERGKILPFLDLGPYEYLDGAGRPTNAVVPDFDAVPYVPVTLSAASRDLLRALWLYFGYGQSAWFINAPALSVPYGDQATSPKRSGGALTFAGTQKVMIYPDEAEALADWAIAFRMGPRRHSWRAFREELTQNAPALFSRDFGMLDDGSGTVPVAHAWVRAKADTAFFAATLNVPDRTTLGSWMNGGIAPSGILPPAAGVQLDCPHAVLYPNAAGSWPSGASPYQMPLGMILSTLWAWPVGLTLAPPVRFEVASTGISGTARAEAAGGLKAAERLEFTSQEDFELKDGGDALLERRGIRTDGSLPAAARRITPGLVTVPNWNIWGVPDAPNRRFSRHAGGLALAAFPFGPDGADEYWGFEENFTPTVPEREFTSLQGFEMPAPAAATNSTAWWTNNEYAGSAPLPPWIWPGMRPGGVFDSLSISFWCDSMAVSQVLAVSAEFGGVTGALRIVSQHAVDPGLGECTRYSGVLSGAMAVPYGNWTLIEGSVANRHPASGEVRAGQNHLVLTLRKRSGGTFSELFVNGQKIADNFMPVRLPDPADYPVVYSVKRLTVSGDEIRFYDRALDPPEVRAQYDLGRFFLPLPGADSRFRSPRYDLGTGGTLGLIGWTGIPAGETGGAERIGIEVWVYGYDSGGAPLPGAPWKLSDTQDLSDLSAIGPMHSFEYEVRFVNLDPANTAPLYRTPIFESVWFILRRPGRAPAWTAWK